MPEEMDWFGALIGDWDMIWRQDIGTEKEFVCKGEWIFSRVLNGFGIQDLLLYLPEKKEHRQINREQRDAEAQRRFEMKQLKKKEKRRGH